MNSSTRDKRSGCEGLAGSLADSDLSSFDRRGLVVWFGGVWLAIVLLAAAGAGPSTQPVLSYDFERSSVLPEDVLVLAGEFSVKKEDNNSYLELTPAPIDSYAVLFGREDATATSILARIFASSAGKRFPEFGVGLAGSAGYKLRLMPATGQLQLLKNEDVLAIAPYVWTTSTWTTFHLRITEPAAGKLRLEGKAHPSDKAVPAEWMLSFTDADDDPPKGRAGIFASPYSETPIRFDDIVVR